MTDVSCTIHSDKSAVGFCARCQRSYCSDCLDTEMGQPICVNCKKNFTSPPPVSSSETKAAPSPLGGGSPFNFKGKGLDDDPLGLLGGGPSTAPMPKMSPPKLEPPKPFPTLSMAPPVSTPPILAPKAPSPLDSSASKGPPIDLGDLMNDPQPLRPPFPKAPGSAPAPFSSPGELAIKPQKAKSLFLVKIWIKFLVRKSYEMFDPLAKKLKVPTYVFLGILLVLGVGVVVGAGTVLNQPSIALVESIQPIHFVRVSSVQISEMDVTTYADLQNQVQTLGFTPLMQMTIPQVPSPNFFDVGLKGDAGTYSELIKMPGQITPHLSFVTYFNNGVMFSTNAWNGDNQQMDYLISEFYPSETPNQLYVQHIQGVDKLKQEKDWQVQAMDEKRYLAALSDHLRWFLAKKDIPSYKADFNLWH
jgi:hypothetical protein